MAKVHAAGDLFKPVAVDVCRHIGQKTFNDSVVSLGLLSESELPRGSNDDSDITVVTSTSGASASTASSTSILTVTISNTLKYEFCFVRKLFLLSMQFELHNC